MSFSSTAAFIWSVADLLRGDYKQSDYGKVILPFTLLRRLECVLEPTREAVLAEYEARKSMGIPLEVFLTKKSNQSFYNTSKFSLSTLMGDAANLRHNLETYIADFSPNARDIFERYKFTEQLAYLDESNLLYKIVEKFAAVDLHPDAISNHEMGLVFEELIRRFAEASNETAGEHFTPRDIVRLTTSLLFMGDDDVLTKAGIVRSLYDPTAGTGGFLSSGSEYVYEMNPDAKLVTFGQELNPESYAICKADMLIKGQAVENIKYGNTLSDDQLYDKKFDYMLSNPPFGVEWKKVEKAVKDEHTLKGYGGRFGPGLPRVSDGSLLFLLHLISKMRPKVEGGSRIGIILNGSPLFTGGAGSGESEIRRYILENDLLEAIVAMPTDMFFNTGIATYIWILSNHKAPERTGKVQLINAAGFGEGMRKNLGNKRKRLSDASIDEITRIYGTFEESKISKIFDTTDFGYRRITVERPLIENGKIVMSKGNLKPDTALRDNENIPLREDINEYFKREVLPHVPDAWISEDKKHCDAKDGKIGIVGYEIPFNRHFYEYVPPRSLEAIDAELDGITKEILDLLNEVHS
ncbi:MAG: class I SAM-dependent DNA methyltransferase [Sulfurimonas sp.]|nr:class I SAM-dependent DNA methyltransferase [Sulfurimonas sp.]